MRKRTRIASVAREHEEELFSGGVRCRNGGGEGEQQRLSRVVDAGYGCAAAKGTGSEAAKGASAAYRGQPQKCQRHQKKAQKHGKHAIRDGSGSPPLSIGVLWATKEPRKASFKGLPIALSADRRQ